MKRFINPLPNGIMPIFKQDMLTLQEEASSAYNAHLIGLGEPIILSGCEVTVNSPSNLSLTAGIVFLNGDCIRVSAYTGTFPCWLSEGTPVADTKVFKDGSTQNVFTTRLTKITTSDPGGSSIKFDPYTSQYYRHVIKRQSHDLGSVVPYIGPATRGGYDLFDGSGNGKWEWKNFRISLKGKMMLGFDPSTSTTPTSGPAAGVQNYGAIGNTGGADAVSLTTNQNGPHTHNSNVKTDNVPISFDNGESGSKALQYSAGTQTTGSSGTGEIHENRPAYTVVALLERY